MKTTITTTAKMIVKNGMKQEDVFCFFNNT